MVVHEASVLIARGRHEGSHPEGHEPLVLGMKRNRVDVAQRAEKDRVIATETVVLEQSEHESVSA